jgi:hypothetical protein
MTREESLAVVGTILQIADHPSYGLVFIPTELFWLHLHPGSILLFFNIIYPVNSKVSELHFLLSS